MRHAHKSGACCLPLVLVASVQRLGGAAFVHLWACVGGFLRVRESPVATQNLRAKHDSSKAGKVAHSKRMESPLNQKFTTLACSKRLGQQMGVWQLNRQRGARLTGEPSPSRRRQVPREAHPLTVSEAVALPCCEFRFIQGLITQHDPQPPVPPQFKPYSHNQQGAPRQTPV